MKSLIACLALFSTLTAQAAPKKVYSHLELLDASLDASHSVVKQITARIPKEFDVAMKMPISIKLRSSVTNSVSSELESITVIYQLEPKDGGDTYFCESDVKVNAEKESFKVQAINCEI